ncbi:methionine adenosyltransferase [Spiroplasma turonicum]|uniref:S-adenosylmethionine synthase n=1 Tax=Spiroplasma turonicum TaxID=216946 RepID=A0A0K1P5J6_9MOLU|nr:methionine adenosyltransferase [Spiroplasma turonicum]AKU79449.1 S-adenosylmethionine synthetase [Spiroplasma turonicum]ALX70471.1 S-adenosylmethionine synthetase [Spiroplasma turonicum]
MKKFFTSESVSEGHPDKLCDQISDAILDACLEQDPESKVACEVFVSGNFLVIGGEISSSAKVNYEEITKWVLSRVGYNNKETGIDPQTCEILIKIKEQSKDISLGVDKEDTGAGDQGIMFGYATNETSNYMPCAIQIAHDLVHLASKLRKLNQFKYAQPDMKSQVTMDYENYKNPRIDTILMSIQHDENYDEKEFKNFIVNNIMNVIAKKHNLNTDFKVLINPTGRFVIGGPISDAGLTGRKIIVDSYGGYARHGGGAFSGKDPSKVDRSAAYMARYVAKNLVAAGLADQLEIQVSYAIGVSNPISIFVESFGTNKVPYAVIYKAINETFNFNVKSIIETLDLKKPIYFRTSKYGHFGKKEFSWEKLDKVRLLEKYL